MPAARNFAEGEAGIPQAGIVIHAENRARVAELEVPMVKASGRARLVVDSRPQALRRTRIHPQRDRVVRREQQRVRVGGLKEIVDAIEIDRAAADLARNPFVAVKSMGCRMVGVAGRVVPVAVERVVSQETCGGEVPADSNVAKGIDGGQNGIPSGEHDDPAAVVRKSAAGLQEAFADREEAGGCREGAVRE